MNDNKINNVEMKLYANARHDLFHEINSNNSNLAMQDMINWIFKNI